jgi:hypothetical protein
MRGRDLYIIQQAHTGNIKVGRSNDVHRRLRNLQTGSPYRLRLILHVEHEGKREREIHQRMHGRGTRRGGEWFEEGALSELPEDYYGQLDLEHQDWWRF